MVVAELLTVMMIHLLALMSPGPDFVMISRSSLIYSRKIGLYASLGLALGILVHVTYCLVGIGFIISQSIVLFSLLKFAGAAYLIYIGYQCLRAQPHNAQTEITEKKQDMSADSAVKMGFLTNVLNPKASIFFFALFTQVINPDTAKAVQVIYGLVMSVMTFGWFALVTLILSHRLIRNRFLSIQHYVERAFGVILGALGVKVALSAPE